MADTKTTDAAIDQMVDEAFAAPAPVNEPDVEITDESLEEPADVEIEPAKTAAPEPDPIEELKASLAASERANADALEARRAADERAARAEREAQDARGQVHGGHLQQIAAGIENVGNQIASTKRDWAAAMQQGDYERAGDLQNDGARLAAQLVQLEQGKASLERQRPMPQQRQQAQPAPVPVNPVDAMAQQLAASGNPRSADWIRRHPDVVTDPARYNEMMAAHHYAVKAGHAADSEAYLSFVEDRMGIGGKETMSPAAASSSQPAPRRAPVAAAPVSRSSPVASANGRAAKVTITKGQLEAGRAMGLSDADIIKAARQIARDEGTLQ